MAIMDTVRSQGDKLVSGSLDAKIIEELLHDAFISSTDISKRLKAPLSTVQRRRRYLENTILTRRYEIDLKKQGFRIGELTVVAGNGASKEIISGIFSRTPTISFLSPSRLMVPLCWEYWFTLKQLLSLHDMMMGIQSLPEVKHVKFAETVEIVRNKRNEIGRTVRAQSSAEIRLATEKADVLLLCKVE